MSATDGVVWFGGISDEGPVGDEVDRLVAEGRAAALAPNTRKAYDTGWRNWSLWASERGLPVLPADPGDLQKWLAALLAEGKKPTTLSTYLAAVGYWHRHGDGPNPAHSSRVRELLHGLRRRAAAGGYMPRQAAPLRHHHIEQIADTAHRPRCNQPGGRRETRSQARRRAKADIAMVSLAHDALLRCAELLALTWADVDLPEDGGSGTVLIHRSKTDQTGQGAVVSISEFTCAALTRLKPADAQPCDPVFDLSPNTVSRRMRAAARAAGIDPTRISSHSPRVGMAQDLAADGVDTPGLLLAGRWKTTATVARYIRHLTAQHTPAAQYLKTQRPPANKAGEVKPLSELLSELAAMIARLQPAAVQAVHQTRTQISDRRDRLSKCGRPSWPPSHRGSKPGWAKDDPSPLAGPG
ncbi:MAG: tyrosine-type recombinase/integrase [bacterium]|nr:tyrosine-type recombinase/integrase [bacterium]